MGFVICRNVSDCREDTLFLNTVFRFTLTHIVFGNLKKKESHLVLNF